MIKHHSKKIYIRDHKAIKPEFVGKSNKVRMRVVDQTTLDTLLLTDTIMLYDYKVLDKLQGDYNKSGLVGVKATTYIIKDKSSRFDYSHNVRRELVMGCVKYIGDRLGRGYKNILLKLLDNKKLSKKQIEWFGDKKKVGKLSTIVNEFYEMWNKG